MALELIEICGEDITKIESVPGCEMSIFESAFLLKLLDQAKPLKILEIGLAAGGTSVMLLQNTAANQEIYGIDIAESYYRNPAEKAGYLIGRHCSKEQIERYHIYLGMDPLYRMQEFGPDMKFDFVILDTSHVLPGELLTFFVIYKYLHTGCIVVLHDLLLNFAKFDQKSLWYRRHAYATNVLFTAIGSRRKLLPAYDKANIGAFIVDEQTEDNLEASFMALSQTWATTPEPEVLEDYFKYFKSAYSPHCANYFHNCMLAQPKLVSGVY